MAFHVGQKVVCVDVTRAFYNKLDEWSDDADLVLNSIYTIRRIGIVEDNPVVWLEEILRRNAPPGKHASNAGRDLSYGAFRFRPLIERKTSTGMAILRKIADDASNKTLVPVDGEQG